MFTRLWWTARRSLLQLKFAQELSQITWMKWKARKLGPNPARDAAVHARCAPLWHDVHGSEYGVHTLASDAHQRGTVLGACSVTNPASYVACCALLSSDQRQNWLTLLTVTINQTKHVLRHHRERGTTNSTILTATSAVTTDCWAPEWRDKYVFDWQTVILSGANCKRALMYYYSYNNAR